MSPKNQKSTRKFFHIMKILFRESLFILWIQLLGFNLNQAHAVDEFNDHSEQILNRSQISYSADGGFTGVNSYSVIISCVDGKISVLKTISDPRVKDKNIYEKSTMDRSAYLALWDNLERMQVFNKKDGKKPSFDVLDEFTTSFSFKIGDKTSQFEAFACSRPECAQYFAIQNLLDKTVQMNRLWDTHQTLVRN